MKIAYLHGLESTNISAKNDWLRTFATLFDPAINYREKHIYSSLLQAITQFAPDLLIGSSMGGFFAYQMAKTLNVRAVLFNPALHSRSIAPDLTGHVLGKHRPDLICVLGSADTVIAPKATMEILAQDGYGAAHCILGDHGHRTPFEVFKDEISKYLSQ